MPRYFFRMTGDRPFSDQEDGIELRDRDAAWKEATESLGEMIRDIDGELPIGGDWAMEVSDEEGLLFIITINVERRR